MRHDSPKARGGQDSLGQQIIRVISNVGFAFFVLAVLTITVIAVTYQPPDPLTQRGDEMSSILSVIQNSSFRQDNTVIVTGEEFGKPNSEGAITRDDVADLQHDALPEEGKKCSGELAVDCLNPGVKAAIEAWNLDHFPALDFYKYRQPVHVPDDAHACDVAWKYRAKSDGSSRMYRDYRRFVLKLLEDCKYEVVSSGTWHSGHGAKPGKYHYPASPPPPPPVELNNSEDDPEDSPLGNPDGSGENHEGDGAAPGNVEGGGDENPLGGEHPNPDGGNTATPDGEQVHADSNGGENPNQDPSATPAVIAEQGIEVGVDNVQVADLTPVATESSIREHKYLLYERAGDYCKHMNHFTWSFLCALGEAKYLERTFVMDLDFCLSWSNNPGHGDELKDFRLYFDLDHLKEALPIVEVGDFWNQWKQWNEQHPDDQLQLRDVPEFQTTPMDLKEDDHTLVRRQFPLPEPDNYWYRVCEGPAQSVVERPWSILWKSKRILNIVEAICGRMEWKFDVLHVIRGDKAKNHEQYPHLDADTQPDSILDKLQYKLQIQARRNIYIATNEVETSFFDKLRGLYNIHFLDDFKDLWEPSSDWYESTKLLLESRGQTDKEPEFDGYMRVMVDSEVLYRAEKKIETFNDLTADCKNGVNTC